MRTDQLAGMQGNFAKGRIPPEILESAGGEIDAMAVPDCPVCGARDSRTHAVGFDYELRTCRNAWRFVRCAECTHVWLNPRPAISTLPVIYPSTYYAYNYDQQVYWLARAGKQLLDVWKMKAIQRWLKRRPHTYMDIGCGNGRFLRIMERQARLPPGSLYGLDIDHASIRRLSHDGYQVFCDRVEDFTSIPDCSIDIATMFHVLEHVNDPVAVVRKITSWLSPGGIVAIETPNIDSTDARLFQSSYWGGYHFPRHWNLFSPATLARVFERSGLQPVTTMYQTGHSFWAYSFHHFLRYKHRPWRRLAEQFDPFRAFVPLVLFTGFDRLRGACGFRTSSMLMLGRKAAFPSDKGR
jgi:SAM-dependent methyltransferase